MEALASTPPTDSAPSEWKTCLARPGLAPRRPPLAYGDVYVDDFLLAAQTKRQQQRVLRAALHSIDRVLRSLDSSDRPSRNASVSVKKLRQGDAHWATHKTILGWNFDTVAGTLTLPEYRLLRLYALLDAFPRTRKHAPLWEWYQLLGELRSMAPATPGARGLFSTLQDALSCGDRTSVRLSSRVFDSLDDFRAIADSLVHRRPTRFRELVAFGDPVAYGACDASQRGMGCVWFRHGNPPLVWRTPFPSKVQCALIISTNRSGTVSISDLARACRDVGPQARLSPSRNERR